MAILAQLSEQLTVGALFINRNGPNDKEAARIQRCGVSKFPVPM